MEKPEPSRRGGHHRTPIEPPVNFPVRTRTSGDILLMEVSDPGIAFPPNGQMTGNLGDGRLVLPPFALGHQSSFVDSSASSNKSMDSSQQQDASCTLTEEQKAHAQPPIWMRVNVELQPRNLPPAMLPPPPFLGGGAMQQQQLMHHQQLMQIHQHQLQQMQHMQHMHEQLQQNQQLQQPLPQQPQQQLVYNPGGYPTTYLSYTIPTLSQQLDWIPSLGMPSPETGLYNIQGLTQPNNSLASTRPGTISPALRMMGPQIQNMPQQGTSSMDGSTFLSTASTAYPPSTLPLTNTIYLTAPIAPDAIPSFIKGQKRKRSESGAKVAEKQQKHLPSIVAMRQSVAQLSVRVRSFF